MVMKVMDMASASTGSRGAEKTKGKILAAAKEAFGRYGYSGVGIRELAESAGVNNALIGRYYGSKAGLFEAALIDSIDLSNVGEMSVDAFVGVAINRLFSSDQDAGGLVLRSAGDQEVRDIIIKVTNEHVIPRLAKLLPSPNAEEKAQQFLILASGFLFSTRLMPVGPQNAPSTVEWLQRSLRSITEVERVNDKEEEVERLEAENASLRRLVVDLMLEKEGKKDT